jgi:hypothetical protein
LGDPVSNGDILRTKAKTKVSITFTDGNTLWLAEKTRMKISRYATEEKSNNYFDLFRGKSRAVVTKLARGSTFELHTPTAVCGVRGTILFGLFLNGESSFFLQGGAGYGYNRSNPGREVDIPAGYGMVITDPNAQPVVKQTTAADIEQHMQDTSAGEGQGAEGLSDAGTTLDPAAAWTPETVIKPPTPELFEPSTDITFSTPVLTGGFGGTLNGSFDPLLKTGTISFGGYGPLEAAVTPLDTPLTGILTYEDDLTFGTFTGLMGGVPGSYHGFFNSIVNRDGALGLLQGNLDGTFIGGAIDASGTLKYTSLGYTAGGFFQAFENIAVPTFSTVDLTDISYMTPVETGLGYGYPTSGGGLLGIWGSASTGGYMGGYYYNPGLTSWSAYYGYDSGNNNSSGPSDVYMLGLISGTDDLAGHTTITANDSIQYMDYNYFGLVSVNYRGYYSNCDGNCEYATAGTGTFKLAPLAFSGPWGGDSLELASILYNDSGYINQAGEDYGLVGGFSLPWNGATTMYAMGGYYLELYSGGPYAHYLWNTPVEGAARTGEYEWDMNRWLGGYTAGLWLPGAAGVGTLEGAARMLFTNLTESAEMSGYYGGTIGILGSNNLAGNWYTFYQENYEGYYEDGMWRAEGTLSPYYVEHVSDAWVYRDSASLSGGYFGGFRGTFNSEIESYIGGALNSDNSYIDFFVVNGTQRPWGIYNMAFEAGETGGFFRPTGATNFTAYTGGEGYFSGSSAKWLASVKGTWNDAGEIRGWLGPISGDATAFGVWMDDQYLGTIGGPFYGVNMEEGGTSGTWVGTSIGTYVGQPLAFKGSLGDYGDRDGLYNLAWDGDGYGYLGYSGGYFGQTSSYLNGLYGSTTAPTLGSSWSASSAVTMLGDFYANNNLGAPGWYSGKFLWNYATYGLTGDSYFKAGDNAGFTAGVANMDTGAVDGATAMLYVDASGNAGILTSYNPASFTAGAGGITGNIYPFYVSEGETSGMWLAKANLGGIKYTQDNYFNESGESRFAIEQATLVNTALYQDSNIQIWGYGGSEILNFNNPDAPGALPGGTLPWGVYDLKFTGIFQGGQYGNGYYIDSMTDIGNPGADLNGKAIPIGGNNGDAWFQIGTIYDTVWSDNRIDGKISGRYMTLTDWGTFSGPFYGLYSDPVIMVDGAYEGFGAWTGEGVGIIVSTSPLAFAAQAQCGEGCDGTFWDYAYGYYGGSWGYQLNPDGEFYGLVGGLDSLFTGTGTPYTAVDLKGMGIIGNASNYPVFLGRFQGQGGSEGEYFGLAMNLGGVMTGNNTSGYTASGSAGGAYWKQTDQAGEMYVYEVGILYSPSPTAAGFFTVNIPLGWYESESYKQMWELGTNAKLQAYAMGTIDTDLIPGDTFFEWTTSGPYTFLPYEAQGLTGGYGLAQEAGYSEAVRIADGSVFWSVGSNIAAGYYTLPESGSISGFNSQTWTMAIPYQEGSGMNYDRVSVTSVDSATGVFTATNAGASANYEEGWTSVHGSAVKGLFNPDNTWRAIAVGVGMETGAFLTKVQGTWNGSAWVNGMNNTQRLAFQNATSIPSFTVGTVDLQTGGFVGNLDVNMNNVVFLSSASGSAPSIWATQNVGGSWTGTMLGSVPLKVNGTGLDVATFTVQSWAGSKWGATVISTANAIAVGGYNVYIQGGAAGTSTGTISGTFTGTGAGVVLSAPPPPLVF